MSNLDKILTESKYDEREWHPILYAAIVEWEKHHATISGLHKERRLYERAGDVIAQWKSNRVCGQLYLVSLLKDYMYTEAILACNYLEAHAIRQKETEDDFKYLPYLPTFMENQPWRWHPIPLTKDAEKKQADEVRWIRRFVDHLRTMLTMYNGQIATANEQLAHNKKWLEYSQSDSYKATDDIKEQDEATYVHTQDVALYRLKSVPIKIEQLENRIRIGQQLIDDMKTQPFASVKHGRALKMARQNIDKNISPKSFEL